MPLATNLFCLPLADGMKSDGTLRISIMVMPEPSASGAFHMDNEALPSAVRTAGTPTIYVFDRNGDRMPVKGVVIHDNWPHNTVEKADALWLRLFPKAKAQDLWDTLVGTASAGAHILNRNDAAARGFVLAGKHAVSVRGGRHYDHAGISRDLEEVRVADSAWRLGVVAAACHLQELQTQKGANQDTLNGLTSLPAVASAAAAPFRDVGLIFRRAIAPLFEFAERRFDSMARVAHFVAPSVEDASRTLLFADLDKASKAAINVDRTSRRLEADYPALFGSLQRTLAETKRPNVLTSLSLTPNSLKAATPHFAKKLLAHGEANPIEQKQSHERDVKVTDKYEQVRRKLAGIRSFPTVAKFLGMIVDVEISAADAASFPASGFIGATFGTTRPPDMGSARELTAFALDRAQGMFYVRENPRSAEDGNPLLNFYSNDYPLQRGLAVGSQFTVGSDDPVMHLYSTAQQMMSESEALANGALPQSLSSKLPEVQNRGLHVLYREAFFQSSAFAQRAVENVIRRTKGETIYHYAEDLIIGVRPDVRRTRTPAAPARSEAASATPVADEFLPLMIRTLSFHDIRSAYGRNPDVDDGWHPYPEFQDRDHGVARALPKLVPNGTDKQLSPAQTVLTWMGDPLGVPAPQIDKDGNEIYEVPASADDFDLGHTYDVPISLLPPPVLRVGDSYEFGMRAVMPHGGDIGFDKAVDLYDKTAQAPFAGEGFATAAFPFLYQGDLKSPIVLLPHNDPFLNPAIKAPPLARDDRIVLRSGSSGQTNYIRRILVPPKVNPDVAEQFGLFDPYTDTDDVSPPSAFLAYQRVEGTGAFPDVANHAIQTNVNRSPVAGGVLAVAKPTKAEIPAYYPHPLSRTAMMLFERNLRVPTPYTDQPVEMSFWNADETPFNARPVVLDFYANKDVKGAEVQAGFSTTLGGKGTPPVTAHVINVAPAEFATLWYWVPDANETITKRARTRAIVSRLGKVLASSAHTIALAKNLGFDSEGDADDKMLDRALDRVVALSRTTPFAGNSGWGKLTVVHAVDQPLEVPAIRSEQGGLVFKVVRPAPETEWAAYAATSNSPIGIDLASERGATHAHFVGQVFVHRMSTAAARCEATWVDWTAAPVNEGTEKSPNYVHRRPKITRTIFDVDSIPIDLAGDEQRFVNLFRDEARTLRRGASYEFGNTAARLLHLRLIGTSRFANEFDADKIERPPGAEGQFELESRPHGEVEMTPSRDREKFDEAALDLDVQIKGNQRTVLMKATERPPKPAIDKISWVAPEKQSTQVQESDPRGKCGILAQPAFVAEKSVHPRLWLSSPVFTSGNAEKIAVICVPGDLFHGADLSNLTTDDFKTTYKDVAEYVARWGRDPVINTGSVGPFMAPEAFQGWVGTRRDLGLPLPVAGPERRGARAGRNGFDAQLPKVAVALYQPMLDTETGRWYVDIPIVPRAHMTWVRLAIANYQPYAEPGLELSQPLALDPIQIPASRTVEIHVNRDESLTVRVMGLAYTARAPDNPHKTGSSAAGPQTNTPLLGIRLLRALPERAGTVVGYDKRGHALVRARAEPTSAGRDNLEWLYCLAPPSGGLRDIEYVVQIDELELHIPDVDLATTTDPASADYYVEKPALFSIAVPIFRILQSAAQNVQQSLPPQSAGESAAQAAE
ncbi:MAG: hypothetical protein AB7E79_14720 [Rhodospirillaceae bacterium]